MANVGKLDRQELVSSKRPADARNNPCQGSTRWPTFSVRKPHSATLSGRSLTGRPRYLIGNFPSLQLSKLATLCLAPSSKPDTTTSLLSRV
jgi:hypothetical protein